MVFTEVNLDLEFMIFEIRLVLKGWTLQSKFRLHSDLISQQSLSLSSTHLKNLRIKFPIRVRLHLQKDHLRCS